MALARGVFVARARLRARRNKGHSRAVKLMSQSSEVTAIVSARERWRFALLEWRIGEPLKQG